VLEEDASVLLLQEDGSTGLDLSFATHIVLLNRVADPALQDQIISRANRMGATGPVEVITLLCNEVESD
jgi:SNF2 family DNA or RNA helicase